MAKVYRIKFSDCNVKIAKTELLLRELEIAILKQLFDFASINSKKVSDINLCIDCIGQLKSVEKEGDITFTKSDLELLNIAIDKSAGQRLPMWNEAVNLWKQLGNPEEVEV